MRTVLSLFLGFVGRFGRSRRDLLLENLALRHQLVMCERHPRVTNADRVLWAHVLGRWSGWRGSLLVLHPDTVVRWQRSGWRRYWARKSRARRPGRRRIPEEARALILRLARENPRWGAVRIRGELQVLGHEVSAETVRRYRRQARRRPPSQRWRTFLANHRDAIWAADFLTVPTLCGGPKPCPASGGPSVDVMQAAEDRLAHDSRPRPAASPVAGRGRLVESLVRTRRVVEGHVLA